LVTIQGIEHKFRSIARKYPAPRTKPDVKDFEKYYRYIMDKYKAPEMMRFYVMSIYKEKTFPEGDPLRDLFDK